jgi:hypothetical protein
LGRKLDGIPLIGVLGSILPIIGYIMMIGSVISIVFFKFPTIKKNNFNEAKIKIIEILTSKFDISDKKQKIANEIIEKANQLVTQIDQNMSTDYRDLINDGSLLKEVQKNFELLINDLDADIKREIAETRNM